MSWTPQAEALAADAEEAGAAAAVLNSACWAAGVDPAATAGLVGAATTLGAPFSALFPSTVVTEDDRQMLRYTEDLEADTGEALKHARDMAEACEADLEAAQAAAAAAQRALSKARSKDEANAARAALGKAQARIADCECALELLEGLKGCLEYALGCLARVPDDLAVTYEAPYDLIRRGGKLPHSGEFLTETVMGISS
jgi:hypothetical protein